jgi:hypothetical protein
LCGRQLLANRHCLRGKAAAAATAAAVAAVRPYLLGKWRGAANAAAARRCGTQHGATATANSIAIEQMQRIMLLLPRPAWPSRPPPLARCRRSRCRGTHRGHATSPIFRCSRARSCQP